MGLESNYSLENFDPEVLREYDIRGIVGSNLNENTAYTIGRTFGFVVKSRSSSSTIVAGFDGRLTSPKLHQALCEGLKQAGTKVIDVGMGPTPMIYFAHYHAGAWITDAETVASTIVWKEDANIDYYDFDASDGDDTVYCENGDTGDCFNGFYEIEQLGRTDTLAYYLPHGPDWMENPYEKLDYESASDWTGGMIPFDWGLQYDPRGYVLISEISTGIYVVQFDGDINPEICVNSGVNCEFECKNGNYDS